MELLPLLLLPFLLLALLLQGVIQLSHWIVNKIRDGRFSKRQRIEAELNAKRAALRATILDLASQLGADAHEARRALIRESFLASQDDYPFER